jgi:hypothetical protein
VVATVFAGVVDGSGVTAGVGVVEGTTEGCDDVEHPARTAAVAKRTTRRTLRR